MITNLSRSDDDRPPWAHRLREERSARGWSQREAVRAMRAHSSQQLPAEEAMIRSWKRWEAGDAKPDRVYQTLLAKTLGTVTAALFPSEASRVLDADVLAATGLDTLEIVARLRCSDLTSGTLEALRITTDRLCSDYPHVSSAELRRAGHDWLRRITALLDCRLTLSQHRELLTIAGYLTLLVGCLEYDMGDSPSADASRLAALSLGKEADNADVIGWAHEMRAWYSLTQGDYRGAIVASEMGQEAAPGHAVAVQLAAQKAKAWARIGDRRQAEVALDAGRRLLESLPQPENLDNHFVVDPAKFDFYAMDCYRSLGEDRLAETFAAEVLRVGTDFDGTERSPMRNAEARVTLGVVAARRGDLESAIHRGTQALAGTRRSLPSLAFASRELAYLLRQTYAEAPETTVYLEQLRGLATAGAADRQ
jgi:transcriptional regulator with XRE-family HTH domain